MISSDDIIQYRTNHAESDWDECVELCTITESYGFFNLFKKTVVDKEKLYELLCRKHRWYWKGDFGYFRDHWNYWFVYHPAMKDNPYLKIIPFPAQGLVACTSAGMDVYRKYWRY